MSYARTDATAYLADEWSRYLTLAGLTSTDAIGGVKTVIDRAFTAMGVARASLATASLADMAAVGMEAVLDKYAARRLHKALGDLVAVAMGDPRTSKMRQQAWEHLDAMLPTYDAAAATYETVRDANSWQAPTSAFLDSIEPLVTS